MTHILCIDDDQDQCEVLEMALCDLGYRVTTTTSPAHALELAADSSASFDVILTDLSMAEMSGLSLCERMLGLRPDVPVIVLTGQGSIETAIAAMRAGAYDFLTKPFDLKLLGLSVARAVEHYGLRSEVRRLKQANGLASGAGLLGESAAMKRVNDLLGRVAATDVSVLILGETGTGKELVARALHAASPRSKGPFIALNCAALPANLLESELFGHSRGAFTDAKNARNGLFLEASQGTLLLDEIGEMPLEMQTKLLRALQERKVRPVGSDTELPFDARIIAATHRDLDADVEARTFREDLFYRINVVRIEVPPLRERGSDVLKLAAFFLNKAGAQSPKGCLHLSPQVAERLLAYDWPGNVRELENCIERAVALARFDHLTVEDLPEKIQAHRPRSSVVPADAADEIVSLHEYERRYIQRVLKQVGGNETHAAQLLGITRRMLQRKLESQEPAQKQPVPEVG